MGEIVLSVTEIVHEGEGGVHAASPIDTEPFDVLLSDLHMPGAGDGFAVISAMRHKNPDTIRFLFTGYPALQEAVDAILLQVDEILMKPIPIPNMLHLIREKLKKVRAAGSMNTTISDFSKFAAGLVRGDGLSAGSRAEMTKPSLHITTANQFPNLSPDLPLAQQRKDLFAGLGVVVFDGPQGHGFYKGGLRLGVRGPRRQVVRRINSRSRG